MDQPRVTWRTSSYSTGQGNCVEVGSTSHRPRVILVRDSRHATSPTLRLTAHSWQQFLQAIKDGESSPA